MDEGVWSVWESTTAPFVSAETGWGRGWLRMDGIVGTTEEDGRGGGERAG